MLPQGEQVSLNASYKLLGHSFFILFSLQCHDPSSPLYWQAIPSQSVVERSLSIKLYYPQAQ